MEEAEHVDRGIDRRLDLGPSDHAGGATTAFDRAVVRMPGPVDASSELAVTRDRLADDSAGPTTRRRRTTPAAASPTTRPDASLDDDATREAGRDEGRLPDPEAAMGLRSPRSRHPTPRLAVLERRAKSRAATMARDGRDE